MTAPVHVPVMLDRVLALLAPALTPEGAVVVDATLGLGGHAEALLEAHPGLRLIGLDRDPEALRRSEERLASYSSRIDLVHAVYDELPRVLSDLGVTRVQGLLFDLGVSSMQLDRAERGFSYSHDAPLDMRMDPSQGITAGEVLNTYDAGALARVLFEYGEERFARRIADAVVRERARHPLTSTARLAELVRDAVPAATRRTGGNPAKRTFQALRIEVNGELTALERVLPEAVDALAVAGRLIVLSYQSLEDRLVKRSFAPLVVSSSPIDLPVDLPGHEPVLKLLTRGAELPSEEELARNPRSSPARMRAVERLREAA